MNKVSSKWLSEHELNQDGTNRLSKVDEGKDHKALTSHKNYRQLNNAQSGRLYSNTVCNCNCVINILKLTLQKLNSGISPWSWHTHNLLHHSLGQLHLFIWLGNFLELFLILISLSLDSLKCFPIQICLITFRVKTIAKSPYASIDCWFFELSPTMDMT